ncbi:MAG: hydroxymethylglutaryl-CoA reductase (NADPH) [Methanomicrobiales archaeon]
MDERYDSPEAAMEKLVRGEIRLHALEEILPVADAVRIRRMYIEDRTGGSLGALSSCALDLERATKRNIENMIGCVHLPVGVAGPLLIDGEYTTGSRFLPLATTEGALVASVNRGCSAITRAGGATVRIIADGMTRAPVFACRDVGHLRECVQWIEDHQEAIREAAEATTSHGKLLEARPFVAGTSLFLRLRFDTGDAMGMNMVTIASEAAATLVEQECGARLVSLSGNLCTDKKPAAINAILGRGKTVVAGVRLDDGLISQVFKTDADTLCEVNYRKNLLGSVRAGSLGFNAQAANIIAALYIACGQDPAHVVEGSSCITTVEREEGGVYVTVTAPVIQVGTVGGGTGLGPQAACLGLLGVAGGGTPPGTNAKAFAEIVATAILAGELSLLGALAAQHLARAHRQHGRG